MEKNWGMGVRADRVPDLNLSHPIPLLRARANRELNQQLTHPAALLMPLTSFPAGDAGQEREVFTTRLCTLSCHSQGLPGICSLVVANRCGRAAALRCASGSARPRCASRYKTSLRRRHSHMGRDGNKIAILTYRVRATFAGWGDLHVLAVC